MDAMLTFESDMFCNVTRLRQAGYDGQVRSPAAHGQALVAVRRGSCGWPCVSMAGSTGIPVCELPAGAWCLADMCM